MSYFSRVANKFNNFEEKPPASSRPAYNDREKVAPRYNDASPSRYNYNQNKAPSATDHIEAMVRSRYEAERDAARPAPESNRFSNSQKPYDNGASGGYSYNDKPPSSYSYQGQGRRAEVEVPKRAEGYGVNGGGRPPQAEADLPTDIQKIIEEKVQAQVAKVLARKRAMDTTQVDGRGDASFPKKAREDTGNWTTASSFGRETLSSLKTASAGYSHQPPRREEESRYPPQQQQQQQRYEPAPPRREEESRYPPQQQRYEPAQDSRIYERPQERRFEPPRETRYEEPPRDRYQPTQRREEVRPAAPRQRSPEPAKYAPKPYAPRAAEFRPRAPRPEFRSSAPRPQVRPGAPRGQAPFRPRNDTRFSRPPRSTVPAARAPAPRTQTPTPRAHTPRAPTPRAPTPRAPTPRAQTPRAPTPRAPTPRAPTPRAQTPRAPTPRAPTPRAPTPSPRAQAPRAPGPRAPAPTRAPAPMRAPGSRHPPPVRGPSGPRPPPPQSRGGPGPRGPPPQARGPPGPRGFPGPRGPPPAQRGPPREEMPPRPRPEQPPAEPNALAFDAAVIDAETPWGGAAFIRDLNIDTIGERAYKLVKAMQRKVPADVLWDRTHCLPVIRSAAAVLTQKGVVEEVMALPTNVQVIHALREIGISAPAAVSMKIMVDVLITKGSEDQRQPTDIRNWIDRVMWQEMIEPFAYEDTRTKSVQISLPNELRANLFEKHQLATHFCQFGDLLNLILVCSKRGKGNFGIVTYGTVDAAGRAFDHKHFYRNQEITARAGTDMRKNQEVHQKLNFWDYIEKQTAAPAKPATTPVKTPVKPVAK